MGRGRDRGIKEEKEMRCRLPDCSCGPCSRLVPAHEFACEDKNLSELMAMRLQDKGGDPLTLSNSASQSLP